MHLFCLDYKGRKKKGNRRDCIPHQNLSMFFLQTPCLQIPSPSLCHPNKRFSILSNPSHFFPSISLYPNIALNFRHHQFFFLFFSFSRSALDCYFMIFWVLSNNTCWIYAGYQFPYFAIQHLL